MSFRTGSRPWTGLAAALAALLLTAAAAALLAGGPAAPRSAAASGKHDPIARASGRKRVVRAHRWLRRCTNVRRRKHGLRKLKAGRALNAAARRHARNMARLGFFGHTDTAGRGPSERVALFKPKLRYVAIGENIAGGQRSSNAACKAWMDSPSHRANMLGRYNRLGVGFAQGGYYGRYYVVVFGRAR